MSRGFQTNIANIAGKNLDFSEATKRTQQDDGSYKCNRCGENFGGDEAFSNLKDHIIAKCKQPIEIQCGDCGKPFSNQSDLMRHIDLKHLNKIQNFCGFGIAKKRNPCETFERNSL